MFKIFAKPNKRTSLFCLLFLAGSLCQAGQQLDKSKYITVDEIRPGMEAYCLTVYKGTKIEKFDMEVLDVVRNWMPGKDAILVQGTDERFIYTGPVAGCSGSPVYIDGRLAGALARSTFFSKDPFYIATPIEEMLRVGRTQGPSPGARGPGFAFDFSKPIDFAEIDEQLSDPQYWNLDSSPSIQHRVYRFEPLPCPLVTSGLPGQVVEQLDAFVKPFGLMAVAGIGGSTNSADPSDRNEDAQGVPQLVPGACLAVPLVTGDITAEVIGTVTEVLDDKVYGFGHRFLGYGPVDLPMATAKVHTVVSSMLFSVKFGSAVEVIGALTADESTAVLGRIGARARMIPLAITVARYNDTETRVYNCRLANNRLFTPLLLRWSVAGAALMLGRLPPDHMIEYKVTIGLENAEPITFENVSTRLGLAEITAESTASVALLMNNPYKSVDIESIDVDIRIEPKNIVSHIWSVELSDSKVKAGEEIEFEAVVESFLAEKKKYRGSLKIPDELAPGKYDLLLCGAPYYLQFLRMAAPYRFIPQNLSGLIEAINNILHIKRDKLFCLLALPAGGIAVEKAELPDLPATKALIFQDMKRTLRTQPYRHWDEKSFRTGTIIVDKKVMHITVEK
jgi:hypothetical protein